MTGDDAFVDGAGVVAVPVGCALADVDELALGEGLADAVVELGDVVTDCWEV